MPLVVLIFVSLTPLQTETCDYTVALFEELRLNPFVRHGIKAFDRIDTFGNVTQYLHACIFTTDIMTGLDFHIFAIKRLTRTSYLLGALS